MSHFENNLLTPVIIAGGSGTRLWPKSRASMPKQFHPIANTVTMFEATLERFKGKEFTTPTIVCNEDHRFIVADQLTRSDNYKAKIILEPFGRNTAPAIALAAFAQSEIDPNSILVVSPADHYISNLHLFRQSLGAASEMAKLEDKLVCLGVTVTRPETGFGYIKKLNIESSPWNCLSKNLICPKLFNICRTGRICGMRGYLFSKRVFISKSSKSIALEIFSNLSKSF